MSKVDEGVGQNNYSDTTERETEEYDPEGVQSTNIKHSHKRNVQQKQ